MRHYRLRSTWQLAILATTLMMSLFAGTTHSATDAGDFITEIQNAYQHMAAYGDGGQIILSFHIDNREVQTKKLHVPMYWVREPDLLAYSSSSTAYVQTNSAFYEIDTIAREIREVDLSEQPVEVQWQRTPVLEDESIAESVDKVASLILGLLWAMQERTGATGLEKHFRLIAVEEVDHGADAGLKRLILSTEEEVGVRCLVDEHKLIRRISLDIPARLTVNSTDAADVMLHLAWHSGPIIQDRRRVFEQIVRRVQEMEQLARRYDSIRLSPIGKPKARYVRVERTIVQRFQSLVAYLFSRALL